MTGSNWLAHGGHAPYIPPRDIESGERFRDLIEYACARWNTAPEASRRRWIERIEAEADRRAERRIQARQAQQDAPQTRRAVPR